MCGYFVCMALQAKKYGPEKATRLNTYAAMKSGMKNWDGSGCIGSNLKGKAKARVVCSCLYFSITFLFYMHAYKLTAIVIG